MTRNPKQRNWPRNSFSGRKDFLPVEPQSGLSFLFLLGRTQVRLIPLLYQVSGHRQICFRHRGGLSNARVPSAAQTASFPVSLTSRGTCHLNPQPVSLELAALALPGLLPRVALLALRFRLEKYAQDTFSTETECRRNSGS